jgi:hypothetical protein
LLGRVEVSTGGKGAACDRRKGHRCRLKRRKSGEEGGRRDQRRKRTHFLRLILQLHLVPHLRFVHSRLVDERLNRPRSAPRPRRHEFRRPNIAGCFSSAVCVTALRLRLTWSGGVGTVDADVSRSALPVLDAGSAGGTEQVARNLKRGKTTKEEKKVSGSFEEDARAAERTFLCTDRDQRRRAKGEKRKASVPGMARETDPTEFRTGTAR